MSSQTRHTANHYYTNTAKYAPCFAVAIVMMLSGCGERLGADAGDTFGDTFGDTATTGDEIGDTGTPPTPGAETRCVERDPGVVTCWVDWGTAKARVLLPCQAEAAVVLGVWSPAYDDVLEWWGPVSCHDVSGTDYRLCLYSGARVLLTETAEAWVPEVSPTVCGLATVPSPCG